MFDGIFYVITELSQAAWHGLLGVYGLRPLAALVIFLIISAILWATRKSPKQNVIGAALAVATFILVMPSGISSGQEILRQTGLEGKYDCTAELVIDYKYWTGEKDSSLVCEN